MAFVAELPEHIIVDEVQRIPQLLSAAGKDRRSGRFLLTGSANVLAPAQASRFPGRQDGGAPALPTGPSRSWRRAGQFPRQPVPRRLSCRRRGALGWQSCRTHRKRPVRRSPPAAAGTRIAPAGRCALAGRARPVLCSPPCPFRMCTSPTPQAALRHEPVDYLVWRRYEQRHYQAFGRLRAMVH